MYEEIKERRIAGWEREEGFYYCESKKDLED